LLGLSNQAPQKAIGITASGFFYFKNYYRTSNILETFISLQLGRSMRSTDAGEVVRQIPNEVVVRVAHNIEKMKGLLLNAKA
jgi:recombinational DNA repair ATPase RecF